MGASLTGTDAFLIFTETFIGGLLLIVVVLNIAMKLGGTGLPFEKKPAPPLFKIGDTGAVEDERKLLKEKIGNRKS